MKGVPLFHCFPYWYCFFFSFLISLFFFPPFSFFFSFLFFSLSLLSFYLKDPSPARNNGSAFLPFSFSDPRITALFLKKCSQSFCENESPRASDLSKGNP